MALAFVGFFMNMFNLLPMLPLDGGRAAAALHPAIWLAGLVGLIVWEVLYPSPVIPIILILGGYELWRRWRYRNSPGSRLYYSLLPQQRLTVGVMYFSRWLLSRCTVRTRRMWPAASSGKPARCTLAPA